MTHRAIRQGDEVYCSVCGLRWGVGETEPTDCTPRHGNRQPPRGVAEKLASRKRVSQEQWDKLRGWAQNGFKDEERPDI